MKKTVLVLGQSGSLNGRLLDEILKLLKVDCIHAVHLHAREDPQKTLVQHLVGGGGSVFGPALDIFKLASGYCDPKKVEAVVVDTNLPLGDTFQNGEYSQLEDMFSNLQWITLVNGPNEAPKAIPIQMAQQAA